MQDDNLRVGFHSIESAIQRIESARQTRLETDKAVSKPFEQVLRDAIKTEGLSFSKHAESRMAQRDITLSQGELEKLTAAVDRAEQKGVRNTLVLMNEMAFIVNIPGGIVITAMKGSDLKENVFTQIDGAVIA